MFSLRLIALASLVILFSGCAQKYGFRVDALSRDGFVPPPQNKISFVIENADPDADENDLRFQELASIVSRGLIDRGYVRAASGEKADLVIMAGAEVSDPLTENRRFSEPIYHRTGGYSRVIRRPVIGDDGKVKKYVYSDVYVPPRSYFAGYIPRNENITVYEKVLYLSAREASTDKGKPGDEVWTLQVKSRDTSTDLRAYLPYMMAAALPYLGERTQGEVEIVIDDEDPAVEKLR